MALSLTSYNISQFTIDISAFQSAQVAYVKLRHYSNPEYEAMLAFFYDSASEYYFNATLNDNPIPYDFSSEGLRLSTSSFEGSLVLTLYYISDVYLAFSSSDFKVEQTLVLPVSDNGSGDGSTSVDSSSRMPSLNGNGSRYRDGSTVKVTTMMDEFKVAWSGLVRTDANIYTIFYDLLRKMPDGEFSEFHCVPESLVYLDSEIETGS